MTCKVVGQVGVAGKEGTVSALASATRKDRARTFFQHRSERGPDWPHDSAANPKKASGGSIGAIDASGEGVVEGKFDGRSDFGCCLFGRKTNDAKSPTNHPHITPASTVLHGSHRSLLDHRSALATSHRLLANSTAPPRWLIRPELASRPKSSKQTVSRFSPKPVSHLANFTLSLAFHSRCIIFHLVRRAASFVLDAVFEHQLTRPIFRSQ